MDLQIIENELKKRWQYPYRWGRRQTDSWDWDTNFIYKISDFDSLLEKINGFNQALKDYALNRWYNFWSAQAVEYIFCLHENVVANKNQYDKLVDFKINDIPFDHKTSVYPKRYMQNIEYAKNNKSDIIGWLYENQSQQGRKHLKNRLFVVLYDGVQGEHWKLKAEIGLIQKKIDCYVNTFNQENLSNFNFGNDSVYSDVIWVEKI